MTHGQRFVQFYLRHNLNTVAHFVGHVGVIISVVSQMMMEFWVSRHKQWPNSRHFHVSFTSEQPFNPESKHHFICSLPKNQTWTTCSTSNILWENVDSTMVKCHIPNQFLTREFQKSSRSIYQKLYRSRKIMGTISIVIGLFALKQSLFMGSIFENHISIAMWAFVVQNWPMCAIISRSHSYDHLHWD